MTKICLDHDMWFRSSFDNGTWKHRVETCRRLNIFGFFLANFFSRSSPVPISSLFLINYRRKYLKYLFHLFENAEVKFKVCRRRKGKCRREHLLLFVKSQKLKLLSAISYNSRESSDGAFTKKIIGITSEKQNFFRFPSLVFCIAQADVFSSQSALLWLFFLLHNSSYRCNSRITRFQVTTFNSADASV